MEFYPKKLSLIRKTSCMSIKYITSQLNIGRSTYWNWENSKRTPSEVNVRSLAKIMNISVKAISDLTESQRISSEELFNNSPHWGNVTNDISQELIRQQETAINKIRKINFELSKVWKIVQGLLRAVEAIIYIKDTDNKYLAVNDSFKKNLSLVNNYNVSGKTDYDFFPISDAKTNSLEDEAVMNSGESVSCREDYIPGTKKKKWGEISKYPISDNTGNISGLISVIKDISETKKLRWKQIILMYALNNSNDIFVIRNIKSDKYIFISETVEKKFGYSIKDITDTGTGFIKFIDLLHPEDKAKEIQYRKLGINPSFRRYRVYHKDGRMLWIEMSSLKTSYDNEEYLLTIIRDKTEDEKVSNIKTALQTILSGTKDIIWLRECPPSNKLLFITNSVYDLYGHTPEEFYKDTELWFKCIPEKDRSKYLECRRLKAWKTKNTEQKIIRSDGKERWIEFSAFSKTFLDMECIATIERDITARKTAELRSEKKDHSQNQKIRVSIAEKMVQKGYPEDDILKLTGITKAQYTNIHKSVIKK
jgi:PAS domain S-box-containing protein